MKSLLNALQEGRLIELPDNQKDKAFQYLAALLEAIPELNLNMDVLAGVMEREKTCNTGIGKGWACPHVRSNREGELFCAVGWSPAGIDYGSSDQQPVHLLIMFYIPESQKNIYLKEVSSLARAIQNQPALQDLRSLTDLSEVRNRLLDIITLVSQSSGPEVRARMIRLEARQAAVAEEIPVLPSEFVKNVLPLSVVITPGMKPIVLTRHQELVPVVEAFPSLAADLARSSWSDHESYRVIAHNVISYQGERHLYECFAFRTKNGAEKPALR